MTTCLNLKFKTSSYTTENRITVKVTRVMTIFLYTISSKENVEHPQTNTKNPSKINSINFTLPVKIDNRTVEMLIDSGSSVNILDAKTYDSLFSHKHKLRSTHRKLFAYGTKNPLDIKGTFETTIETCSKITLAKFYVINNGKGNLLSGETAAELNMLKITVDNISAEQQDHLLNESPEISNTTQHTVPDTIEKQIKEKAPERLKPLLLKHRNLFSGMGKMKHFQAKLHIDETVKPIAQKQRRIPYHIRKKVSAELKRLENLDIIEDAVGPTPWVSPIVIRPKQTGDIRICVDMRLPNQAIERERHLTPTLDDLITDLNGAKHFTKLDLNSAYHQIELNPESRYITTFTTHKGLKRYKRLNFGTTSASELFQHAIEQVIYGIPGAKNISDDLIIHGKTQTEHDSTLKRVLQELENNNLTLGLDKCEFDKNTLEYFGHIWSEAGISPSPSKITAILNMKSPQNPTEVRSFLGMLAYTSRYIPDFATLSEPLRNLTKKDIKWNWTTEHQTCFETLQNIITSKDTMAYFDLQKETTLIVDASPVGLGAILTQNTPTKEDTKIIAYASRALTTIEKKYSQLEKEALAIVWGCEHFRLYLQGQTFTLYTDNKPVEFIFKNPKSKTSARIERWGLRLQPFSYRIKHKPGVENPSDYLSRHPESPTFDTNKENSSEEYVQFIATNTVPKSMNIDEIKDATRRDETIQIAIEALQDNNWKSKIHETTNNPNVNTDELRSYEKVKQELSFLPDKSLLLRGTKLVIPSKLRQQAIQIAHEGHMGIVKTKQLIREKIWFPNIDKTVQHEIQQCLACQVATQPNHPEPLQMTKIPDECWDTLNLDFLGPLPSGDSLLVIIDQRSRYPEVEIMKSTTANSVTTRLDRIFATHGIPKKVITDNGPPFQSYEFSNYLKDNGIIHRKITPLWPKANSEAESFMKPLAKIIRAAHTQQKPWKKEMYKFLLNYRATPHSTTKVPPATALFNRSIRTKLPQISTSIPKNIDLNKKITESDRIAKDKMKEYSDKRIHAKPSSIEIGDTVIVLQPKQNKLTTRFDPKPYTVTDKKGTMITATREGHQITRNTSHFKKYTGKQVQEEEESSDEEEIQIARENIQPPAPIQRRYPRRNIRPPRYFHDEQ